MKKMIMMVAIIVLLFGAGAFANKDHSIKTDKSAILVKCPVTGSKIDPAKAYSKTVYKGKTYYFCCAGCPEEFKKNPGKYIKKSK